MDASYYADPSKLYNAPMPASSDGTSVAQLAYDLDQQHDLRFGGSFYEGLLGLDEKWLLGGNGWYFIKTDGGVYRWKGSIAESELLGRLDASYHADPSKLYDAIQP